METTSFAKGRRKDRDLVRMLFSMKSIAQSHLKQIQCADPRLLNENVKRVDTDLKNVVEQADRFLASLNQDETILQENRDAPLHASLYESIDAVLKILHTEYPFDRVTVVKIIPRDLVALPMTCEHLETILFQLLSQARRAIGRSGGMITIEAHEAEEPSSGGGNCRQIKIRIADTGPLIPEDDLEHIFDPVFEPRSYRFSDGLGLHTARKLVEEYHGSIRVQNAFRSASFFLEIPLHQEKGDEKVA